MSNNQQNTIYIGDVTNSGSVNINDAQYILNWIASGGNMNNLTPDPYSINGIQYSMAGLIERANVTGESPANININDAQYILNWIASGGNMNNLTPPPYSINDISYSISLLPVQVPVPKTEFFISNSGLDNSNNNGSINAPYKSLSYLIETNNIENSRIYFREGLYNFAQQEINKNNVEIVNYNDEYVIFDGTKNITEISLSGESWQPITKQIVNDDNIIENVTLYRIKLDPSFNPIQLFNNREEIINARYPSAQWNDDSVYDLSNWCHGYYNKPQESDPFYYDNGSIIDYSHNNIDLFEFVNSQLSLDPSFTLINAMINLNVGSFKSYTKIVNSVDISQTLNRITLNYDTVALWKTKHHYYYLENKLEFLNSQNEWFYDLSDNYLYVRLTNDKNPLYSNIRVKLEPYILDLNNCDDVTIKNINFFGTTIKANSCDNLNVNLCNFLYPSCYAHMLNEINPGEEIEPSNNQV